MNIRALAAAAALGCVTLVGSRLAAQAADEGTLILLAGDREIGGETFRVVLVDGGRRVSSKSVFTGAHPPIEFTVSSERAESGDLAFQLAYRGPTAVGEVYAVQQRSRLTIRRVERGTERASEAPGGAAVILLADSTFAPLLQLSALAGEVPRPLTAVFPRSGRRLAIRVRRSSAPEAGGSTIEVEGDLTARILLGNRGELLRIFLPALGMEAVRRGE